MRNIKVKAVIFDMDGVITNTMPFHYRAWKKVFKEENIIVNEREIYSREGQPGNITVKEIFKEYGLPISSVSIAKILSRKEVLFKKTVRRRFIRGSRQLIHYLKSKGFLLALVTGTARHEVERILPKKLLLHFNVVVTGNEVKRGKPHPEPYLIALKQLRVKPDESVVLENAPFGISSAKRANIMVLAIETSLPKTYLKGADYIFASFKELSRKINFKLDF